MMKMLFDHLQKTGGTALTDFLRQTVGGHHVSPLIQHESIIFSSTLTDRFNVVAGHLHLSPAYEPNPDTYHLTILRDPIERFISHYSYVCEQPGASEAFARLARRAKDLSSLLLLGDAAVLVMVKDFYVRHFGALFLDEDQLQDVLSDDRLSGRDLFELVSSRYHLIGISENLNAVAKILSCLFGLSYAPVPRVRVTKQRPHLADLDTGTLKILRKLTARDYEFYSHAKAQFETLAKAFAATAGHPATSIPAPRQISAAPAADRAAVLAAELFCPTSGHNDRAVSGDLCMLSFALDSKLLSEGDTIALRITNVLHQLVFRDTLQLLRSKDDAPGQFELILNFVCPFGAGDYVCALGFGLRWVEDVYRFGVDQRLGTSWAGLVNIQSETIMLGGPPNPDQLMGWLTPSDQSRDVLVGEMFELSVEIGNTGGVDWEPQGIYRIVLSYRLSNPAGESVVKDGLRTLLVGRLRANETRTVTMRIQAPDQGGQYVITPSFVCERIAWFGVSQPIQLAVNQQRPTLLPRVAPKPPGLVLLGAAGRDVSAGHALALLG